MKCNYCGREAELKTGDKLYRPGSLSDGAWRAVSRKWFYVCEPCDAHVGCHGKTKEAYGTLANRETRGARREAHSALDVFWDTDEQRTEVYRRLAGEMGLTKEGCHIGMFDFRQCMDVVAICSRWEMP